MRLRVLALLAPVLLAPAQAQEAAPPPSQPDSAAAPSDPRAPRWRVGDELIGTSWRAETIRGEPVADPGSATIEFLPGDHVRGQVACNRYVGPFATRSDRITFGPLRVSRLKCGTDARLQTVFLDTLHRASRVVLTEDRLELHPLQGPPSRFVRSDAGQPR